MQGKASTIKSTNDYPKFQAFVYSLDTLLPIVDLKQKGYRLPNANQAENLIRGISFQWGGLFGCTYSSDGY
jgi:hypothetical protein